MKKQLHDELRQSVRAKVFKALGHPSRLRIIERLAQGSCYVSELQEMLGVDMSTVSKHLQVLRETGLVRGERQAKFISYSLVCPCVIDFMACVDGVLEKTVKQDLAALAIFQDQ
jgi:ArsR family transcriptional regulator